MSDKTHKPFWEHPNYLKEEKRRLREIESASELLKRTANAIRLNHDTIVGHKDGPDGWVYHVDDARAAIAAVAEWLDSIGKHTAAAELRAAAAGVT